MIYDIIIVGGGSAGLFAAANIDLSANSDSDSANSTISSTSATRQPTGLILDAAKAPGRKLLMAGGGQCNLTHAGDIKDFITHYGPAGKKIRPILYGFNNDKLTEWFSQRRMKIKDRGDGKIFPETMSGQSVLDLFLHEARKNGFQLRSDCKVTDIQVREESNVSNTKDKSSNTDVSTSSSIDVCTQEAIYNLTVIQNGKKSTLTTRKLLITCGGCSYPTTGSDGSIFAALKNLDLEFTPCKPSLVPLSVEHYPYGELSGRSVKNTRVSIYQGNVRTKKSPMLIDDVLMTHKDFSGPAILNMSRYAENGLTLEISWIHEKNPEEILSTLNAQRGTNKKQFITILTDEFPALCTAHLRLLCKRADIDPTCRLTDIRANNLKTLVQLLTADRFTISGTAGYKVAMATAGGIKLSEINTNTMESKKYPGLYFAGEVLDVDGDTGGYNLQFAFSSAYRISTHLQ